MQLIKSVFLAGLLLTILSAGGFVLYNRGFFNELPQVDPTQLATELANQHLKPLLPSQLASLLPKTSVTATDSASAETKSNSTTNSTSEGSGVGGFSPSQLPFDTQDATNQLETLAQRGQEVSQEIGTVLGKFVEVNESNEDQAAHERAFEYGQYLYCQQVISDYEKNQPPQ